MLKRVVVGSAIAAASWYAFYRVTRWRATWGVDPAETEGSLPGDELVPEPTVSDTRGITIDAPPAAVWPWLLQLGYGRGGWYSYDQLDMKGRSADTILPEHQTLAVGDIVPTDPGGGFEVRVLDPERALVLMVDDELAARRRTPAERAVARRRPRASRPPAGSCRRRCRRGSPSPGRSSCARSTAAGRGWWSGCAARSARPRRAAGRSVRCSGSASSS